ncbi:hypothetical protein NP493_930g00000 [Ridgeia piscesae]|uniref:Secreted protein n=1 Tax=Ridgeia piscesae TaxID=27915 RepID=A0AAD9KK32_RIDPI|nr:hypothetical protein NP493_930g00000 [Ridgeia piscesae]
MMALTALLTIWMSMSPSMSTGCAPGFTSSCFFLCQVMYSSLSMARRKLGSLYCGWTKHRADDTIAAVSGPVTPVAVKNSAIFGVRRNGTGRLASSSPVNQRHLVSSSSNTATGTSINHVVVFLDILYLLFAVLAWTPNKTVFIIIKTRGDSNS